MSQTENQRIFLSHNITDKNFVRTLGAALKVTGANVWFDEWSIKPGETLAGEISEGLSQFTTFVLVWSESASASEWVSREWQAALSRVMGCQGLRIIPVKLDEAPLPAILADLKYLTVEDQSADGTRAISRKILDLSTDTEYLRAVQAFVEEAGLNYAYFHGYGVVFACPKCGAPVHSIEPWGAQDPIQGDQYAGARCTDCGWSSGGEV